MNDNEYRIQLNNWLSETYDVTFSTSETLPDEDFDLYVIDTSRVEALLLALRDRQDAALPLILPALLIATQDDDEAQFSDSLKKVIHDVLSFPLSQSNFERRIANTLQLRSYSQENFQVHQQRERLQNAIASSDDAVAITDENGRIIYSNAAFFQMYVQLSGNIHAETIPPEFLRDLPILPIIESVARTQTTVIEEIEFSTATQGNRTYLFRVDYNEAEAEGTEILIIATDITDRKRAEQRARDQQVFAEALRDTATALTSTLNLSEVLERILTNVGRVVPHESANIMLIDEGVVRIARSQGYEDYDDDTVRNFSFRLIDNPHYLTMLESLYTIIVPDMTDYEYRGIIWHGTHTTSYIGTPISLKGEVLGFINLDSQKKDFFAETHAELLEAFAEQVAIALYNARLYEQVQNVATFQERQRLARDLHDAVSQTLFSASMIAELLARNWAENEDASRAMAVDLHQLIRGALAETRVLLLELRPEALENAELSELLRQLADAAHSRKELEINVDLLSQPKLPKPVKIAFYRIAQEAINNIVKHAEALTLEISLKASEDGLEMIITDDGNGFDYDHQGFTSQLGLTIMRERAQSIGARLKIDSEKNHGTRITLTWKVEGELI